MRHLLIRSVPRSVRLVLLSLTLPAALHAAPEGPDELARLTGTVVTEDTGVPVSGASVEAVGTGIVRTTDERGTFEMTGLPDDAEAIVLRVRRIGFDEAVTTVTLAEAALGPVRIALVRTVIGLDPVAVLNRRIRMVGDPLDAWAAPGSGFHLSRRDLEAQALAFENVHDVLRQVPGVHVQDEEGFGLRPNIGIRGTGVERSSNITLMEDGILIAPAPYSAPAAYYFPTTARMDGIEVRKGASQIRYGPRTLGGAVNLLSAEIPERREWLLDVAGGDEALLRAHARVGESRAHVGWVAEAFTMRTDGFKELQGGGDTGFDTRDFLGKLRLNSDRNGPRYQELELKVGTTLHSSDETYLGLTDSDFLATPNLRYAGSQVDLMDTDHEQLQLRYFVQPGQRTDVVVTAYRNEFSRNWYKLDAVQGTSIGSVLGDPITHASRLEVLRGGDSADDALRVRANNRGYLSQGVQATVGLRLGSPEGVRQDLELGVRYHTDHEDRLQWDDGYRMQQGRMIRTSSGAPGSQTNRKAEASALSLYLQNQIRWGAWTFVPGLRFETIDLTRTDWATSDPERSGPAQLRETSVTAFVPGVGASWEASPWTTFFGGVHRGFAPPGPGASEETDVENSVNVEAGVRVRRVGMGATVTAFLSDYSNILGENTLATGGTGTGDLFNGGAVRIHGIEAAVDADLAHYLDLPVRVPVRAAYTYHEATFRTDFSSDFGPWGEVEKGDALPYLAPHSASGSLGIAHPTGSLTLSWTATDRMRTEAGQGDIPTESGVPGYGVLNLSAEWHVDGSATVYAAVQNLTNRAYLVARRPAGLRPGLPQTAFLGVRLRR